MIGKRNAHKTSYEVNKKLNNYKSSAFIYKNFRRISEENASNSKEKNERTTQYEKWGTWSDRIGVAVNIVLAAITLLLFSQAIRQNNISEKNIALADSSAKAARLSAIAAQRTVDYADSSFKLTKESILSGDENFSKSLEMTRKSVLAANRSAALSDSAFNLNKQALNLTAKNFEIDNRAIVYFDKMDIAPIEIGKPIQAQITFQNFGKAAAFLVSLRTKISFDTSNNFANFSYTAFEKSYVNLLVPQNKWLSIPLTSSIKIDSLLNQLINSDIIKVFIHGELFFEDIATRKKILYSYCMKMSPNRTFSIMNRHNDLTEITNPRDLKILY